MDKKYEQELKIVSLRYKIEDKQKELAQAEEKREKLKEIKTRRYIKDSTAKTVETAQIVGLGIAGGVAGAILTQGTDLSQGAFALGTMLGTLSGTGLSIINHIAYKRKVLSNKITDMRKFLNEKKIARLNRNIIDLECEKERVSDPVM